MMKFLLGVIFLSPVAWAQDQSHDHHHHHEEPSPSPTSDEDELRDPHEYSNGYTSHSGPFRDPDMPPHLHGTEDLFWALIADRLEIVSSDEETPHKAFEFNSWVGSSFEKLWLKTEGEFKKDKITESENELFWSHAIDPYWDSILGIRYDAGEYEGKAYAALGIHGLAPYWFETSATFYIGDEGRLAFNAEFEYELMFTQRLILSPKLELDVVDLARKEENEHPSKASFGLRLRYEFYRRLAPYIGLEQSQSFRTKERRQVVDGDEKNRTELIAGVRFWL